MSKRRRPKDVPLETASFPLEADSSKDVIPAWIRQLLHILKLALKDLNHETKQWRPDSILNNARNLMRGLESWYEMRPSLSQNGNSAIDLQKAEEFYTEFCDYLREIEKKLAAMIQVSEMETPAVWKCWKQFRNQTQKRRLALKNHFADAAASKYKKQKPRMGRPPERPF
jgi:hypothetical protein